MYGTRDDENSVYMLLEYASGGELFDRIGELQLLIYLIHGYNLLVEADQLVTYNIYCNVVGGDKSRNGSDVC